MCRLMLVGIGEMASVFDFSSKLCLVHSLGVDHLRFRKL